MEASKNPFPFRLFGRPDRVNQILLNEVAKILDIPLGKTFFKSFKNGEYLAHHDESIRDCDVYLFLQPRFGNIERLCYDLDLLETMVFSLNQGEPYRITVIIPCLPFARQDRPTNYREPVLVQKIPMRLQMAGANKIVTLRLHNPSSYNAHPYTIPIVNIVTKKLLTRHILKKGFDLSKFKMVSPDLGAANECRQIAQEIGIPSKIVIINKFHDPKSSNETEVMEVIGDPSGYHCIMPDDIGDTIRTGKNASIALKEKGALDIYFAAIHPILSEGSKENIQESSFKEIWLSDTCDLTGKKDSIDNLDIIPSANLIADAIENLHNRGSINDLAKNGGK